jgi:hypothetical protein
VIYAERWGWTPDQVDNLTLEQEDWLLPIAEVLDKEKAYREDKARRDAERKATFKNASRGNR